MTMHHTQLPGSRATPAIAILLAIVLASACSRDHETRQTSSGAVDTSVLRTAGATPAAGPGIHVTRTDQKSVHLATQYELTDENFSKFMRAADSLATLERRDSTVRAYVGTNLTGAGAGEPDAGLKWLEANARVNNAIAAAGLSVPDYFVAGIAIASAERFMRDPAAAPPTPTLTANAEFLKAHTTELDHLRSLRQGEPAVVSTP